MYQQPHSQGEVATKLRLRAAEASVEETATTAAMASRKAAGARAVAVEVPQATRHRASVPWVAEGAGSASNTNEAA